MIWARRPGKRLDFCTSTRNNRVVPIKPSGHNSKCLFPPISTEKSLRQPTSVVAISHAKDLQSLLDVLLLVLATLLKTKVPQCEIAQEHDFGDSWCCQVEAIVRFAVDISTKLEQRSFKTIFLWPELANLSIRV